MIAPLSNSARQPRWTHQQIRAVRPADNFEVPAYPGLIRKESYWRWPQRHLVGNTIEFFVQVLDLSFHQAMSEITAA